MKFNLFNKNKNISDAVEEDTSPTLGYFFKLLFRKLSKIVSLNLMMLFMVFPILAIFLVYFFSAQTYSQVSPEFASLLGVHTIANSANASLSLELNLSHVGSPVLSGLDVALIVACVIFLAATWGLQNVGSTYVVREMITGKPAFVISDYFYAVKRNFKQGLLFGIFDALVIVILALDFVQLYYSNSDFFESMLFFIICIIIILYATMRMYIYLMMVTFDLSFKKLLKNALIFAVLGIKRNIMAALGIAAVIALNAVLIFLLLPYGIAVPLILPFIYIIALVSFISAYAAFPVIKRYMIDPYAEENAQDGEDGEDAEVEA